MGKTPAAVSKQPNPEVSVVSEGDASPVTAVGCRSISRMVWFSFPSILGLVVFGGNDLSGAEDGNERLRGDTDGSVVFRREIGRRNE